MLHHLASKVGCAAVSPSLARQLSPTQIGVGSQCACDAAVHAIRRYLIDHAESGQSHQNRLIVRLDLKNALSTSRRGNLLRTRHSNRQTGPSCLQLPLYRSRVWSPDLLCYWYSTRRSPSSRSPCDGS